MTKRKATRMQASVAYDHGNDLGPAAQARVSTLVNIGGKARGSIRSEAIEVRRYNDATLYDRMHACAQLSDKQHRGAVRLGVMWTSAGLNPRVCASMGVVPDVEPLDEAEAPVERSQADPDAPTSKDRYRRLMRNLPRAYADILEGMLLGQHPGTSRLATMQAALDELCKRWGIEDER